MKYLLYVLIALASFAAALAGAMALTGNLNTEALKRLMNPEAAAPPTEAVAARDEIGPLAEQLKRERAALKKREQELAQREAQLDQREQELATLRSELTEIQSEIQGALGDAETERKLRLETIAITVANMDEDKAAERLKGLPVEDVAAILKLIEKDKDRGAILEAMEQDFAVRVLQALQEGA